jgi:hypothetical protein
MSEADVAHVEELLVRARAICELARVVSHYEVAEALRPETLAAVLRTVEDLLGHALAYLPAWPTRLPVGHTRSSPPEGNGGS